MYECGKLECQSNDSGYCQYSGKFFREICPLLDDVIEDVTELKFYLAHSFDRRDEIRKIEKELENEYGLELVNPFYDSERKEVEKIDNGEINRWDLNWDECVNIVKSDKEKIDSCNGLLAIIEEPTIGTILEIGYAQSKNIPIFIISEKYKTYSWLRVYTPNRFKNVSEFEEWLQESEYE